MSNDIDIWAIQEQADKIAREEYEQAYEQLRQRENTVTNKELKWARIHHRLHNLTSIIDVEPDLDKVLDNLDTQLLEYQKIKKMLDLIQSNEILSSQWDKLVMTIRLVGGDKNDPVS
jgi:uncharacterized protein Yka (UPF0111/DUF47 family)